ncbi:MAG: crossover junction endodeoxyribonuclease RuvC [Pseudomonadota bacterium]|nr:crossover junction endodeoxyribonuclease RuvC [Pseudomonadota bacterium]
MIFLGIDPGSRKTGYGVIEFDKTLRCVAHGVIRVEKLSMNERLNAIFCEISDLVQHFKPDEAAIEKVFLGKNADSALKLGQARGAAIVAMTSLNLDVAEYSAKQVKQAVVGTGAGKKEQVQQMIQYLMKLKECLQEDAADALAVAVCHAHTRRINDRINRAR